MRYCKKSVVWYIFFFNSTCFVDKSISVFFCDLILNKFFYRSKFRLSADLIRWLRIIRYHYICFSMTDVPSVSPSSMVEDCEQLMDEADEFDLIHDVIIKVQVY